MRRIVLKAYAKINWALNVLGKRFDGYHDVEMVMQSIDLCDIVVLMEKDNGISIRCDVDGIPVDETNTAYRAAALIKERFGIEKGVEIELQKNIPVAAGMAGGSADAAAVLVGLNRMWKLNLQEKDLMALAGIIGSDVPFCVVGGTALARGRGEEIMVLSPVEGIWLVLVTPEQRISTAEVYGRLDLSQVSVRPDIASMMDSLQCRDFKGIARNMVNVLEGVTIELCPRINTVKDDIMRQGAVGCCMSGSGPTVYGLFGDEHAARKAYAALNQKYSQCFVAQTMGLGIQVVEEVF
ncbi:4-(cytidine 5'-diphospho)-2-C-methyl-D-erythritol kinase [Caldicoprobacter algeriensis]|uniref:4-(cytidine 5'-diphospho)-2-C-methyl-D-erythritol kinase n=1 Tax=Caldicoprobacter algeriensis TaxID=699281 RepID=UPI0020796566|nr:4-(cytidine 5'-diphospho)-2-C-methyl-D-erythritol kinase [Caldicoprobacter algeriensis]MCM8901377.1 4-(cytidine 5'-diphospho)-2-C-methyl-D-erythritol kinase [Caldicoprobacter algeriensis]